MQNNIYNGLNKNPYINNQNESTISSTRRANCKILILTINNQQPTKVQNSSF